MTIKNKLIPALALILCIPVSCNKDEFSEDGGRMISITVSSTLNQTKIGLNADRSKFEWGSEDRYTLFNNVNSLTATVVPGEGATVEVPGGTSVVYGFTPASASFTSGPSAVSFTLPADQVQETSGSLSGHQYPFTARSAVKDGDAALVFSPAVGALAFNVYRTTGYDSGEKVESVTVTPITEEGLAGTEVMDLSADLMFTSGDSGADSVKITLGTPCSVGDGVPSDKRCYADQIYLLLARQKYQGGLVITVKTNKGKYVAVSSLTFDCTAYDFLVVGFNLSTKGVDIFKDLSIPAMNYLTVADDALAGIDDPVLLNVGATTEDKIPDFSRVGYHYGDVEPPYVSVTKTITEQMVWANTVDGGGSYEDSTAYIQAMVDSVAAVGGGCLLFKDGTYHLSRTIFIDHDNLVIRGESTEGTVFYGDGEKGWDMFFIGVSLAESTSAKAITWNGRALVEDGYKAAFPGLDFGDYYFTHYSPSAVAGSLGQSTAIIEDYVPVGRLYVEVEKPELFNVGEYAIVCRPHSNDWVADIGMDRIASNGYTRSVLKNSPTSQWNDENHTRYWHRKVTAILGNRIYLDSPVVQSLDRAYGGGKLYNMSKVVKVRECGIENLTVDSWYNDSLTYQKKPTLATSYITECYHESHTYTAVVMKSCENCWVRNVNTRHLGHGIVSMGAHARNITVDNCHSTEPCSHISGNRRYAFIMSGNACNCLVKNCTTDRDRHSFATSKNEGPNVFYNCTCTNNYDGPEPHQRWCTGALFDNVTCLNTHLYIRDRGNAGNGHGWAGANYVVFNCRCRTVEVSNPWSRLYAPEVETLSGGAFIYHSDHPSGQSWCLGTTGKKELGSRNYHSPYFAQDGDQFDYFEDELKLERPDGIWYPERAVGTSGSDADRIDLNNVPEELSSKSWWPEFSGKVASFSNPESLYMSQFEDRYARGIILNNL